MPCICLCVAKREGIAAAKQPWPSREESEIPKSSSFHNYFKSHESSAKKLIRQCPA